MSKFIPNSFQVPNTYLDEYMAFLTPEEWKVLCYAMRRIFGFQKRQDRISLSQFTDGVISRETGARLDYGTGLGRDAVLRALASLKAFGLIIEVEPNDPRTNRGTCYELQLNSELVNAQALLDRALAKKQATEKRTRSSRALVAERVANKRRNT